MNQFAQQNITEQDTLKNFTAEFVSLANKYNLPLQTAKDDVRASAVGGGNKRATGNFATDLYSLLIEYGGPTQKEILQMIKDKIDANSSSSSEGDRVCVSFGWGGDIMSAAYSLLLRYDSGIPQEILDSMS